MSSQITPPRLPRAVRDIAQALSEGVDAAREQDDARLLAASAALAKSDAEQVRLVFGALLRSVLEERHPDGVSGDDLRDLLDRTVRTGLPWFSDLDVQVMIVILTGALGVHEPEPDDPDDWNNRTPPPPVATVVRHASILVADLVDLPGPDEPGVRARIDAVLLGMSQTQPEETP